MKTICVTGCEGLIGWHFRCFLQTLPNIKVIAVNRERFGDDSFLAQAIAESDAIAHFAAMNRGEDEQIYQTNLAIASRLTEALRATEFHGHVVYSSSTHIDSPTRYGQSKREAGEILQFWADQCEGTYTNLVLPHVFGEHGKPFYNSVVSTFAYQIAHGETPTVTGDAQLHLLHAGDVAKIVMQAIEAKQNEMVRPEGRPLTVSQLKQMLEEIAQRYSSGTLPQLDDPFVRRVFNTYRSYIDNEARPIDLQMHTDPRGSLFEAVRSDGQGQTFLSTTKPGITRGNHYHLEKVERFLVVQGQAKIRLRKVFTDEVQTYDVCGSRPQAIDIPTLHTHNITNVGDGPLMTLFWSADLFDPQAPDTYPMEV